MNAPHAWTCPSCGRGSADRRDQGAHEDAHRRLRTDPSVARWDLLARRVSRERAQAVAAPVPARAPLGVPATTTLCGLLLCAFAVVLYASRGSPAPVGMPARGTSPTVAAPARTPPAPPGPPGPASPVVPAAASGAGEGARTSVAPGPGQSPAPLVVSGAPPAAAVPAPPAPPPRLLTACVAGVCLGV